MSKFKKSYIYILIIIFSVGIHSSDYSYIDLTLRKSINSNFDIYGVLENATDNEDIAARAPKNGARSQKPQTFKVGFSYKF